MSQLVTLQQRYHWPAGVATAVVPGYSSDFNGCDLFAFFDERSASSGDLLPNAAAGYALMKPSSECRGVVVFAARTSGSGGSKEDRGGGDTSSSESQRNPKSKNENEADSRCVNEEMCAQQSQQMRRPLRRRDLLLLAEYNHALGGLGAVSPRVHFENIRRAESLLHLKTQSFTVI
jgi:hypothetical protein